MSRDISVRHVARHNRPLQGHNATKFGTGDARGTIGVTRFLP
jgi:hypothetical protein